MKVTKMEMKTMRFFLKKSNKATHPMAEKNIYITNTKQGICTILMNTCRET